MWGNLGRNEAAIVCACTKELTVHPPFTVTPFSKYLCILKSLWGSHLPWTIYILSSINTSLYRPILDRPTTRICPLQWKWSKWRLGVVNLNFIIDALPCHILLLIYRVFHINNQSVNYTHFNLQLYFTFHTVTYSFFWCCAVDSAPPLNSGAENADL